tara:strand:- start:82 stop:375 length:294 start_codon:yes stop_codon:yes gene_type:complete
MTIRRVSPVGMANISATATAILMLILGLLMMLFGGVLASLTGIPLDAFLSMGGSGIVAVILLPIPYFIGTWIFTVIWALIFNLVLKWMGGLHIETSE